MDALVQKTFRHSGGGLAKLVRVDIVERGDTVVIQSATTNVLGTISVYLPEGQYDFVVFGARIPFDVVPETVGPQGPPGQPGPRGPEGPKGDTGDTGAPSTVPGPTGPAGAVSTTPGPQGPKGDTGAASTIPGPTGPQGPKGDTGDTGAASTVPGPAGPAGAASTVPGPTGPAGAASTVPGPAGPQGPKGDTGDTGAASTVPGPTGPAGAASTVPGPTGPQGPKGDTGAASTVPGPTGPAGAASTVPGPTGPQGPKGDTGDTGAASTVPGPTGPAGAASTVPGPTGPQGPKGDTGAASTVPGPTGPAGGRTPFTAAPGMVQGPSNMIGVSAAGITAGSLSLVPFDVGPAQASFDQAAINVGTAAAGGSGVTMRLGLYGDDGTGGKPGALIADLGTVSLLATGTQAVAISRTLQPGRYWLAALYTVTTAPTTAPQVFTIANAIPLAGASVVSTYRCWYASGVAALPATAAATTPNTSNAVIVGLRAT